MINRREFLQVLSIAAAGGMGLSHSDSAAEKSARKFYDMPSFGNVHFLHFTDCHAQLLPIYFREPSVTLGIAGAKNPQPHLVGAYFLKQYGERAGRAGADSFKYLDFGNEARTYRE